MKTTRSTKTVSLGPLTLDETISRTMVLAARLGIGSELCDDRKARYHAVQARWIALEALR